jgi:hypothetical protein
MRRQQLPSVQLSAPLRPDAKLAAYEDFPKSLFCRSVVWSTLIDKCGPSIQSRERTRKPGTAYTSRTRAESTSVWKCDTRSGRRQTVGGGSRGSMKSQSRRVTLASLELAFLAVQPKRSRMGSPLSITGKGRPRESWIRVSGGMPSVWKIVAASCSGVTGFSVG